MSTAFNKAMAAMNKAITTPANSGHGEIGSRAIQAEMGPSNDSRANVTPTAIVQATSASSRPSHAATRTAVGRIADDAMGIASLKSRGNFADNPSPSG